MALLKPHYEALPGQLPEGAVIRDPAVHAEILSAFFEWAGAAKWGIRGVLKSPIQGGGGNREFLMHLKPRQPGISAAEALAALSLVNG